MGVREDAEIVFPLVEWIETLLDLAHFLRLAQKFLLCLYLLLFVRLLNLLYRAFVEDVTEVHQFVE